MDEMHDMKDFIEQQIASNRIVVFSKGTREHPMCGFSSRVMDVLSSKVGQDGFICVDIMSTPGLREALKDYSNWPTFPQVYIKQEFVGGCDIICEMNQDGSLDTLLSS